MSRNQGAACTGGVKEHRPPRESRAAGDQRDADQHPDERQEAGQPTGVPEHGLVGLAGNEEGVGPLGNQREQVERGMGQRRERESGAGQHQPLPHPSRVGWRETYESGGFP